MTDKKKTFKRELIEWTVLISVIAVLFLTGLHVTVFGFIQRGLVETGLIQPEIQEAGVLEANYDFRLVNQAGEVVNFEEFKGQTVFLNFWATWCPPCIAEMPNIQSLYEDVGDEMAFVMISQDEDAHKAFQFVNRKGYEFPVYMLSSRLPKVFQHQSIPTTYVISPEGKIVVSHSGFAKYSTDEFKAFLRGLKN